MSNFQEKISFIWDLADLLRGVYKRNEYQKVILPFTVLKRFDCALSDSKKAVLAAYNIMTKLIFVENGENLEQRNIIKTVYDPACGTGGMLTSCEDFIMSINKEVDVVLFGQEVNPEIYAICKADMLMKGENDKNIRGPFSTLSKDQFPDDKFDFIISNPPYGRKWEQDADAVKNEAEKGFGGRFGAGLPRINDGQLLFLQHMISKMKLKEKSRVAVITNGSPLFTGDAGQGESDIRKWVIENDFDFVEAIIALPNQLFFNTGIHTYIWVLTNEKPSERVGKIQLIDATSFFLKMRKSLGNKRNYLSIKDIKQIVELYDNFEENKYCKIFDNEVFGYTKVIVERPLQLNYQVAEERLENLYSVKAFAKLAESKKKNPKLKLKEEEEGRKKQEETINVLKAIGNNLYRNWDEFEVRVKEALKGFDFSQNFIKNIILALSEHDDSADYVLDKKGNKLPDPNLRDSEKIPLKQDIEEYFEKEVKPYYPDAWMDRKKDKVGYEINFTKYFYEYKPPRPLEEIEKDIKEVIGEIQELLGEE